MRIVYAKLDGFIGIYNGLGLTELEIDFSKSRNHICVISGPNGCGKSTLLNALNLLPDNSGSLVPARKASKFLRIDDNGVIYEIFMNYPIDKHGQRAQTKISIKKDGVELNPNGNVRSYEDIIYNEFNLDDDYVTLSHLSGTDRGLADKRPGERKKFINSINSSMDVYNSIHKNLNKKANTLNGYIKNLTGKIQNIGDENILRSEIVSINNRYEKTKNEIESLKSDIIEAKTLLSVNDPDGTMQQKYQTINDQFINAQKDLDKALSFLNDYFNTFDKSEGLELSEDSINKKIQDTQQFIDLHNQTINDKKSQLLVILSQIQSSDETIEKLNIKIDKLSNEVNPNLDNQINNAKKRLSAIRSEFSSLGIGDIEQTSSDEIRHIIKILDDIIKGVDIIYESTNEDQLQSLVTAYTQGINTLVENTTNELRNFEDGIREQNDEISKINQILDKLKVLDKRPQGCSIDSCPFVVEATTILKDDPLVKEKLQDELDDRLKDIDAYQGVIDKDKELLKSYKEYIRMNSILDGLKAEITSNIDLIKKLSITNDVSDFDVFLNHIANGYRFNSIRDINRYLQIANDITEYKSLSNVYNNLLSEQKVNQTNLNNYNDYNKQKQDEESKKQDLLNKKSVLDNDLSFEQSLVNNKTNKLNQYNKLLSYYQDWLQKKQNYDAINIQFEQIKSQFQSSADILDRINNLSNIIVNKQRELEPLEQEKKQKDTQIVLLNEYQKEYADYKQRYDVIDKLKKYSSPVDGGIQTLFMSLYMGKTLTLANQLLSMIFGGQYRLLDYVINEDEFRMPFIGNGLPVDDISEGSTSQVCIMGMIINLVLLHQASDKFNIVSLDEIDGGLDAANRYMYIDVLQRVIQILNIDQLFIISHNIESNLTNIDVVQLAPIEGYEDAFNNNGVNIIYSYKDRVN